MTEDGRMPVAIYRVDCANYGDAAFNDIVDDVVNQINKGISQHLWKPETTVIHPDGFDILIFSSHRTAAPSWQRFLQPVLSENSILAKCKNTIHRYLCFVGVDKSIFLITGGAGTFHSIDQFVSQQFGLDILVRIIDKNSPVVKGIQDRGVAGIILGQNRYFRDDQKLSSDDDFGKIYKEVRADLQQRILVKDFKFSKESLTRIKAGCLAKSSFTIKKSISFEELLPLTKAFSSILEKDPKFVLNKVSLITRKKYNEDLLEKLDGIFADQIFKSHKGNQHFDVDLLHKEFETYLEAARYLLHINAEDTHLFDSPPSISEIIQVISDQNSLDDGDAVDFKYSVLGKNLLSLDDDGAILTKGSIYEHLHGEVTLEHRNYLRLDEEWYQVHSAFVKDLNAECASIVDDCWNDTLISELFDLSENEDEGDFNLRFAGKSGWLVLDTVVPENIELCDLLHYEKDRVYLVHVKKGFDTSLRDLTAQISIAARRLSEDARDGYKYVQAVQQQAIRKGTKTNGKAKKLATQIFPPGGLKQIFQDTDVRNITFCLAFVDTNPTQRSLKDDLRQFRSNIAKYFLHQVYRSVISFRFDFKIIQLKRR